MPADGTPPESTRVLARGGDLDGGVDADRVWMSCSCGALLVRVVAFG